MNFQDVKLPLSIIAEMYRSSLVQEASVPVTKKEEPLAHSSDIPFKGKNNQRIAVLVYTEKRLSDSSPETVFLLKILKACNLTIDDIAIIDLKNIQNPFEKFIVEFTPLKVLLFSSTLDGSPIPAELGFQVRKTENVDVVYAPDVKALLQETAEAVVLKKKLWMVLKTFFNV